MSKELNLEDKNKALKIGGVVYSTCVGENSVIFAYGKGYTDINELQEDHSRIKGNSFALLDVLKKNGC
tara:strand:+ start:296 stop:499 length:204 start_codon:yes stop_codon:yes gene_type:complete